MNHEAALRIQSWVDGELPSPAAREVADWVERDPVAGALAAELGHVRTALRKGEPDYPLPVGREFYWSRIERDIGRRETPETPEVERPTWHSSRWVAKFLVPAGIVAALALILAVPILRDKFSSPNTWASEIDSPLDDLSSVTFRSESEGLTVVWVNTR